MNKNNYTYVTDMFAHRLCATRDTRATMLLDRDECPTPSAIDRHTCKATLNQAGRHISIIGPLVIRIEYFFLWMQQQSRYIPPRDYDPSTFEQSKYSILSMYVGMLRKYFWYFITYFIIFVSHAPGSHTVRTHLVMNIHKFKRVINSNYLQ